MRWSRLAIASCGVDSLLAASCSTFSLAQTKNDRMVLIRAIGTVTGVAIFGMLLGGGFGWSAGMIAPSFFVSVMPWKDIEPVGFATVLGAFGGVLCGGLLGALALILEAAGRWRNHKDK